MGSRALRKITGNLPVKGREKIGWGRDFTEDAGVSIIV